MRGSAVQNRPFLACTGLDLEGPVAVALRVRAKTAGKATATITWRTPKAAFAPAQAARFAWPAGPDWQEVTVGLPEKAGIIHLRLTLPKAPRVSKCSPSPCATAAVKDESSVPGVTLEALSG